MLVRIKWTNQQTETNWLDTWQNLNPLSKKCMDTREESLCVDLDQLKPFDDFSTRMFCYNYFVSKRQQNFCSITMWNTILRTMILSRKRWLNSIIIEEKKGKERILIRTRKRLEIAVWFSEIFFSFFLKTF